MSMTSDLMRTQSASAMSPQTVALNQLYLERTSCRELHDAEHVTEWRGQVLNVFLRHESDHVFAIATPDQVGMADFVVLTNVSFHVDEPGRQQTIHGKGALPNGRNVHAWLRGTLLHASMQTILTATHTWQQIVYHPHHMSGFQLAESSQLIRKAAAVACTPSPAQVWSVPASQLFHEGASA